MHDHRGQTGAETREPEPLATAAGIVTPCQDQAAEAPRSPGRVGRPHEGNGSGLVPDRKVYAGDKPLKRAARRAGQAATGTSGAVCFDLIDTLVSFCRSGGGGHATAITRRALAESIAADEFDGDLGAALKDEKAREELDGRGPATKLVRAIEERVRRALIVLSDARVIYLRRLPRGVASSRGDRALILLSVPTSEGPTAELAPPPLLFSGAVAVTVWNIRKGGKLEPVQMTLEPSKLAPLDLSRPDPKRSARQRAAAEKTRRKRKAAAAPARVIAEAEDGSRADTSAHEPAEQEQTGLLQGIGIHPKYPYGGEAALRAAPSEAPSAPEQGAAAGALTNAAGAPQPQAGAPSRSRRERQARRGKAADPNPQPVAAGPGPRQLADAGRSPSTGTDESLKPVAGVAGARKGRGPAELRAFVDFRAQARPELPPYVPCYGKDGSLAAGKVRQAIAATAEMVGATPERVLEVALAAAFDRKRSTSKLGDWYARLPDPDFTALAKALPSLLDSLVTQHCSETKHDAEAARRLREGALLMRLNRGEIDRSEFDRLIAEVLAA